MTGLVRYGGANTKLRRALAGAVLVLVGALGITACGGGDSSVSDKTGGPRSDAEKSATSEVPGTAKVTTFDVPATADCAGATSTTVTVSYATEGAQKQELYVDGRLTPGVEAATGTVVTPVHCDPLPHTFVLVAYDENGRRTAAEKKLTTN